MEFDISVKARLAEKNPEEFEKWAKEEVRDFILNSPRQYQEGLIEIQDRIAGKNCPYIISMPIDPEGFERKRMELLNEKLSEIADEEKRIGCEKIQDSVNLELNARDLNPENLKRIAKSNPEKLEAIKRAGILRIILSSPSEKRFKLEQLQWKIDAVIKVSKNPLDACVKLSWLLDEKVYGDKGLRESLLSLAGSLRNLKESVGEDGPK